MQCRRRSLGDHGEPLARDVEHGLGLFGDGIGRDDYPHGALEGEIAKLEAQHRAEVLATALERCQVVQSHDLRDRAAEQGAVEPRRVVHLAPSRLVGLDELAVAAVAERFEQAPRVAAHTMGALSRAAVEGDFHWVVRMTNDSPASGL